MPIDLAKEELLTIKGAAKTMPLLDGRSASPNAVWRWCRKGLNGIQLEYVRFGVRICTSKEAISRFMNAVAAADKDLRVPPSPADPFRPGRGRRRNFSAYEKLRMQQIAEANRRLKEMGV